MSHLELVIVGGGPAAACAIQSYREAGGEGWVELLSRETALLAGAHAVDPSDELVARLTRLVEARTVMSTAVYGVRAVAA